MQFRCVQCSLVCCGVLCHNDNGSWSFPMGFHTFHTNVLFFLGTAVPIGSGCVYNHCFCYNIEHCLLYIQLSQVKFNLNPSITHVSSLRACWKVYHCVCLKVFITVLPA